MIAPKIVAEIRRLLVEEKISQRKIGRLAGVSRGTVAAIASGKRPDYEELYRQSWDESDEPAGPPERCPGCGGLVYMPCQLCRARTITAKRPRLVPRCTAVLRDGPLELDLRPEHRTRYEQVRTRRRELADAPSP